MLQCIRTTSLSFLMIFIYLCSTLAFSADFNGDGKADILWRNSNDGTTWIWLMDGKSVSLSQPVNTISLDWRIAGHGDFDGDGKADILWRNKTTGQNWIYLMDGTNISSSHEVNNVANQYWQIKGVADFDGDGKADIFWHNQDTGQTYVYLMNGYQIKQSKALFTIDDTNWQVAAVGDVNGDNKSDIIWRHTVQGQNYIWLMNGTSVNNRYLLNTVDDNWEIAGLGDMNGDGVADIIWRNIKDGRNWVYLMKNGQIETSKQINTISDQQWQIQEIGDFNGDGTDDIFWSHQETGNTYLYLMAGTVIIDSSYLNTLSLDWTVISNNQKTAAESTSQDGYVSNPDLNETNQGMFNAILTNRNPDCRTYATDDNNGDYGSVGASDRSNQNVGDGDTNISGLNVKSIVNIDMVIVSGSYIQEPNNEKVAGGWNYETVIETTDTSLATHCRIIHNMLPNHDFGWEVGGRGEENVWVTAIDHNDMQITYIPVSPKLSNPLVADDTDRNPTNFMDYDGILLNGIGIAMDSGFCYNPGHAQVNAAGNATGCGGQSVWYEIPAYTLQKPDAENMAAIFDDYFGHGFEGTYHYHAMTHPLQTDNEATKTPSANGSPLIGFAKDGFPIYGAWFINKDGTLVKAKSSYKLKNWGKNPDENGFGQSRESYSGLPNNFNRGTPPTPWDVENRPEDFDFSFTSTPFGVPLGRYLEDWVYDQTGNTGNLDECNGVTDINGVYGYYVTDEYPFGPICTFGIHEPSFGKVPPLRWDDETEENTTDDNGDKINGH